MWAYRSPVDGELTITFMERGKCNICARASRRVVRYVKPDIVGVADTREKNDPRSDAR